MTVTTLNHWAVHFPDVYELHLRQMAILCSFLFLDVIATGSSQHLPSLPLLCVYFSSLYWHEQCVPPGPHSSKGSGSISTRVYGIPSMNSLCSWILEKYLMSPSSSFFFSRTTMTQAEFPCHGSSLYSVLSWESLISLSLSLGGLNYFWCSKAAVYLVMPSP